MTGSAAPVAVPLLRAPADVLLATRMRRPRLPDGHVSRPQLLERIDAIELGTSVLIVAPPGYGKSTLLCEWLEHTRMPGSWLALGADCNTPTTFLAYLIAATRAIHPDLGKLAHEALFSTSDNNPEQVLRILFNECAFFPGSFVLVIDDSQFITDPSVQALAATLMIESPDSLRLVLAGRNRPTGPLARALARGDMRLLTAEDLRFSFDETRHVATQHFGRELSGEELAALDGRVDGWVTGIEMLALAGQRTPGSDLAQVLGNLSGQQRLIEEYFVEEVLQHVPPDVARFLLESSILDRFNAELCQFVTGDAMAGQHLRYIERERLFLIDLDAAGGWYRYHYLFSAVLRQELEANMPAERRHEIHLRASEWYETAEMLTEALQHAVAANAWQRAAATIKGLGFRLLSDDRTLELAHWLGSLPPEAVFNDLELLVIYAWALNRVGHAETLEHVLAAAHALAAETGNVPAQATLELVQAGQARFRGDAAALLRHAERAISLYEQFPPEAVDDAPELPGLTADDLNARQRLGRLFIYGPRIQLGFGYRLAGRPAQAFAHLQTIEAEFERVNLRPTNTLVAAELAAAEAALGRLRAAQGRLQEHVIENPDALAADRSLGLITLGDVYREWNTLDEAEQCLRRAVAASQGGRIRIYLPLLYLTTARVAWARGDVEGVQEQLAAALAAGQAQRGELLVSDVEALAARYAIQQGQVGAALQWANRRGLTADVEPEYGRFIEHMTFARLLIAEDETDAALGLLERLDAAAQADHRVTNQIEIRVLRALAYLERVELDQAVDCLELAIQQASSEGYTRVFLDEGRPMLRLLRAALNRGVALRQVRRLLAHAGEDLDAIKVASLELVEPLTAREIDVLRLIAVGLSNREIADTLFISVATVKRHITNVYGKLGISSRTEAFEFVQRVGLL